MELVSGSTRSASSAGTEDEFPQPHQIWPVGPEISHQPLRNVVRRSSAISNGRFRTYKHPTSSTIMTDGESDNELLFLRFAEMDPTVTVVVAQATRLMPHVAGVGFEHVPDFAIIRLGAAELVEVKSDRAIEDPAIRRRLTASAQYVAAWPDWSYLVTTGSMLREHPLLEAVTDLWRCHRRTWTDLQRRAVLDLLGRRDMSIADVVAELATSMSNEAPTIKQVLSLAAGGEVFIQLEGEIGEASTVRFPDPHALPPTITPSIAPKDLAI